MKIKRTLTTIVLSTAMITGCFPERTTKTLETEEGRLEFMRETKFINLLLRNNKHTIYIEVEKYDGETECYTGRTEYKNIILGNVKIVNPSWKDEFSGENIPKEYKANFHKYIEEFKRD